MTELIHEGQWSGRPWAARAVRVFVLVVPFAASIAFAWWMSGLLPTVTTVPMAILRWLLIALMSTSVMIGFDRLARRLLPLAALFSLTLAFPDQAPSRFKIAMRTGTTLQLRNVVADARAGRVGETPTEAAEKLLELVAALSLHDRLTRGHAERVRAYTHMVGEELNISGAELDHLRWSALLHDIGKLLISPDILNKPGTLTDAEYEVVKQHPELGRVLVAPLVAWLGDASRAVWEHHERWDGMGYPRGLAGTDISRAGRIVAVTDAFDVMTSARSYKAPISPVAARAELARCAGTHFDAVIVRAFLNVSLGRLRMAMGPLSWLTQLSFVPQALVTAGASGATAVTALVGLGAGALGVGLSEDGVILAAETEQSSAPARRDIDDVTGRPPVIGGAAAGPDDRGAGDVGAGPDDGAEVTSTTSSVPIGGQDASTTSTVPTGTTVAPGSSATTTAPSITAPAITAPGSTSAPPTTGRPTTAPGTTQPGTTAPGTTAPGTTAPAAPPEAPPAAPPETPPETTAPATTAAPPPPTTAPTSTVAAATPMGDLTLYLISPGSGSVASQPLLPLTTDGPSGAGVPNYDTDRNNQTGLTLIPGDPAPTGDQRFGWTATSLVRFQGRADATVFVSGPGVLGNLSIDLELRHCAGGVFCSTVVTRQANSAGPLLGVGWASVTVDLGAIDQVLAAGDSLEFVVRARADSSRDVYLAYDSTSAFSRFEFHPT